MYMHMCILDQDEYTVAFSFIYTVDICNRMILSYGHYAPAAINCKLSQPNFSLKYGFTRGSGLIPPFFFFIFRNFCLQKQKSP